MSSVYSFLLLTLLCVTPLEAFANSIEAKAQGSTERQAINTALQQAVEMSLGSEIENTTLVENYQVIRQQIIKHTKGFVRSYDIIASTKNDQGLYDVHVRAEVDQGSLVDSQKALLSLMKMAANPRILIGAIQEDFDALSPLQDGFLEVSRSFEKVLREDFMFDVVDKESLIQKAARPLRPHKIKDLISLSQSKNIDYIFAFEIVAPSKQPSLLRLMIIDGSNLRLIGEEKIILTHPEGNVSRTALFQTAQDLGFIASGKLAHQLLENLRKETYEDGQRFELSFFNFDEKTIKYLETDLTQLGGYSRHKLVGKDKNALTLSYWSMLKAGALSEEISTLLKGQDQTFTYWLAGRNLHFRFNDPVFE